MKHYGDITKIDGHKVPLVDVVCGGSPCQDLSVAGKRAGLQGARSGLFMEQIRVIKEMRDESYRQLSMRGTDVDLRCVRPRYMVWENVPGAFSSNKGADFKAVLEETAKVVCEDAIIPELEGGAKWTPSGCIMGDGWSIAWRVHDAQFWGVPQRRKRIALVADFGGESAPEILFERKGLSGNTEPSRQERKSTPDNIERSIGETGSFQERAGKPGGGKGILIQNERTGALSTINNQYLYRGGQSNDAATPSIEVSKTLNCMDDPMKVFCLQGNGIDRADTAGCNGKGWREDQSYTLNTIDRPAICVSQDAYDKYTENEKSASIKQSGGNIGGAARH